MYFVGAAESRNGCCSNHGGVCGCVCCDGKPLSAKCAPYYSSCEDESKGEDQNSNQRASELKKINDLGMLKDGQYVVSRVIDGDTILLSNGEKVRLIGVDTPETVHPQKPIQYFGKEASAFTKKMCDGKNIQLKYDQTIRDKYGRLLAYVYLNDGTFVNAEIIKRGYGFAYTKYPFKYMEEFRQFELEAKENNRGLWAD